MEMVAASRMRRAQQATLASRAYAEKAWEVLTFLASQPGRGNLMHPLLEERAEVQNIALILFTSDRGLCGAYNINVIRAVLTFMQQHASRKSIKLITVGRRGRDFAVRYGKEMIAEFIGLSERPTLLNVAPISKIAIEEFTQGKVDEVYLVYTNFVNTLVQRPTLRRLLPIRPGVMPTEGAHALYIFEPDPETILGSVLPRFTELQIYQALLESVASEHSARMVAMRSATENARELIGDLTLAMNKARQAGITKEMLDISGGAEALRQALAAK
jgi:F-type H+-transporting ATPase subunit gamma